MQKLPCSCSIEPHPQIAFIILAPGKIVRLYPVLYFKLWQQNVLLNAWGKTKITMFQKLISLDIQEVVDLHSCGSSVWRSSSKEKLHDKGTGYWDNCHYVYSWHNVYKEKIYKVQLKGSCVQILIRSRSTTDMVITFWKGNPCTAHDQRLAVPGKSPYHHKPKCCWKHNMNLMGITDLY